jgi:Zn-finger nucleic acid-binding protein
MVRERDHRRVQQEQRYARAGQQPYQKKKECWLSEIFD